MGIQWVLFIALAMAGIQAAIYRRFGLNKITYERHFSQKAVFAGESIELIESIANHNWLPLPWVKLEAVFLSGIQFFGKTDLKIVSGQTFQYHSSLFQLSPHMRVLRRHAVLCVKRGHHLLQPVSMTSGDLLGMAGPVKHITPTSELFVYPRLMELSEIPHPAHSLLGDIIVRRFISSDPFLTAGVRAYQPGDPLRAIHWTASARTGSLQVRQEDYTADYDLMIYLNIECHEEMWDKVDDPDLVESAISYAASIVHYASLQGLTVGFAANANLTESQGHTIVEPVAGMDHLDTILQVMARLTMSVSRSFQRLLEEEVERHVSHRDIIIISAFTTEKIEERLSQLRDLGNTVNFLYAESKNQHRG